MPVDPQALTELGARLRSPTFQKAFDRDPEQALQRAGIDPDALGGPEVVDVLADLSPQELRLLGNLRRRLETETQLKGHDGAIIF
jgi:hypothetical protein